MLRLAAATLLLLPALASAEECKFQKPLSGSLDLSGIKVLEIKLGRHDLHLNGVPGNGARISGRSCASSQERLATLQLSQRREGDRLVVTAEDDSHGWSVNLFGWSNYAYLDVQLDVPQNMAVELSVGSGDADVTGIDRLDSEVGSGDLRAHGIRGSFSTSVGSGDIVAEDIGEIHVGSVGSGDFTARNVHRDVEIGSIGSGDAGLRHVDGNVIVGSIGSGDLDINGVAHDLRVRSIGSGDISHHDVAGRVDVPSED